MRKMLTVVALGFLVACGGGGGTSALGAGESTEPGTIRIRALDFGFVFDKDRYPAGPTVLVMTNEGAQAHQALLYKLNDGVTGDEFKQAAMRDQSVVPDLSESGMDGIRAAAGPGEEATGGTYDLEPGNYVAICWLPDQSLETNKNHAELGMIDSFVVE